MHLYMLEVFSLQSFPSLPLVSPNTSDCDEKLNFATEYWKMGHVENHGDIACAHSGLPVMEFKPRARSRF